MPSDTSRVPIKVGPHGTSLQHHVMDTQALLGYKASQEDDSPRLLCDLGMGARGSHGATLAMNIQLSRSMKRTTVEQIVLTYADV